jgi:hypothetical protein
MFDRIDEGKLIAENSELACIESHFLLPVLNLEKWGSAQKGTRGNVAPRIVLLL